MVNLQKNNKLQIKKTLLFCGDVLEKIDTKWFVTIQYHHEKQQNLLLFALLVYHFWKEKQY